MTSVFNASDKPNCKSPLQPLLGSSRNDYAKDRCVTTQITAAKETNRLQG